MVPVGWWKEDMHWLWYKNRGSRYKSHATSHCACSGVAHSACIWAIRARCHRQVHAGHKRGFAHLYIHPPLSFGSPISVHTQLLQSANIKCNTSILHCYVLSGLMSGLYLFLPCDKFSQSPVVSVYYLSLPHQMYVMLTTTTVLSVRRQGSIGWVSRFHKGTYQ